MYIIKGKYKSGDVYVNVKIKTDKNVKVKS